MKLSIVIPVFNEKGTIETLLDRVCAIPLEKEVIVVDDCSSDGTREILTRLKHEVVRVIYHERNQGKGGALRTGFNHVTGDVVVIQDADLEYNPDDLVDMFRVFGCNGVDVVYGSRVRQKNPISYLRYYWGGLFLTWVTNLLFGSRITDQPTCYKMIRASLLRELNLRCTGFEFCSEVTAKILKRGVFIHEVPIRYTPRRLEEGKKIRWTDGLKGVYTLLRCRFFDD